MKITSNQVILQGIINQDDRVHQYLYDSILPKVTSYIKNNRGTQEDAEDIFQDALIAIHARLKEGPMVLNCKFSTYLFQICKNMWLKQLQRNNIIKKKYFEMNECFEVYSRLIDEDIMDVEAHVILQSHVEKLDKQCQRIFQLRNLKVPYKDITKKLNIANEAQARKINYKCKERLCDSLRKDPAFIEIIKRKINAKEKK